MKIISKFRQLAKERNKTIVLPEGEEERVIRAASFLQNENLVTPILLGDPDKIKARASSLRVSISNIEIIDPHTYDQYENWAEKFFQLRKHKQITLQEAREVLKDPLFFGAFMLRENLADGAVAGSINITGNVLRAAIQVVGLAENTKIVSSSFIMVLPDSRVLTFADCAVIPDPDSEQLASIALSSARTHERLAGDKPLIAMLSFSTKGSARHERVEKVVAATEIVQKISPDMKIDGELQFDAAFLESVGTKKAPGSPVAGKANVFIFPDLDSGNIGYKITQRLAGAEAIGPVIQGLAKPYNDLSRGCSDEDIINVACICAILA